MLVLGIESSCDETAASVVRDGRSVLSSIVASQAAVHATYGGVVPEIASRLHAERLLGVVDAALSEAGVGIEDIDRVAVANRPGLLGALIVGVAGAKSLSLARGLPMVGVDHVHAHLYAPFLDAEHQPLVVLPALGLVASGGHTSLFVVHSPTSCEVIGRTIDDAVGEAYDKAASVLGLGYPGGPVIDRLAQAAMDDELRAAPRLPISRLGRDTLDVSFSGLKTAVLYAARGVPRTDPATGKPVYERDPSTLSEGEVRGLCASFQRAAIGALRLKMERAMVRMESLGAPAKSVIIGGGVAANSALRAAAESIAAEHCVPALIPELRYCVDNAAMIAGLGALQNVEPELGLRLEAAARSSA